MTKQEYNRLRVHGFFNDGCDGHLDCRVEKKNKNELRYSYWSVALKDFVEDTIKFSDCQDEPDTQAPQKRNVKPSDKDIEELANAYAETVINENGSYTYIDIKDAFKAGFLYKRNSKA